MLAAYGAEVVVCPTAVDPDDPTSYYSVSARLAREIPGAWKPDQYSNVNNPLSHYETTGPEIWAQTEGRITHFVAGMGTGGTISGAGRYLKEVSGGRVQVVGADPTGLGLLRRRRPAVPRRGRGGGLLALDLRPHDRRPRHRGVRRRLVRHDPPAGPDRGAAGRRFLRDGDGRRDPARRRARRPRRGDRRAAARRRPRLPRQDLRRRLARALRLRAAARGAGPGRSATCCARSPAACPTSCTPTPARPWPRPWRSCASTASPRCPSSAPSRRSWRPRSSGRSASAACSAPSSASRSASPTRSSGPWSRPLPTLGATEPVTRAVELLVDGDALLVLDDGRPAGVLTRQDLLSDVS